MAKKTSSTWWHSICMPINVLPNEIFITCSLPEIASGNSERMKLPVVCLVFVAAISIATSQNIANKPGSCPPALPVQSCGHSCYDDSHCEGIGKCCRTQCGGSICSMPVTVARPQPSEKSLIVRQVARPETTMIAQSISSQPRKIKAL